MTTPVARRSKPRFWVTWLAKLLAGETQCAYATWYKGRHMRYEKRPLASGTDLASWAAAHDAQVQATRDRLVAAGWQVTLERQNELEVVGSLAVVAGKPDLVATKADEGGPTVQVIDEKTGAPKPSDLEQVRLYLYAIGRTRADLQDGGVCGLVHYRPPTPPALVGPDPSLSERLGALVRTVAADVPPPQTPSRSECERCDIAACDRRHQAAVPTTTTDDF